MQQGYRVSRRVQESLPPGAGESQGNVVLGWWIHVDGKERADLLARYADTYFESSRSALTAFVDQAVYTDDEALPVLYLVSHSLELALKASYEFRRLSLIDQGLDDEHVKNEHRLKLLLEEVRRLCCAGRRIEFLADDTCDFVTKVDEFNVGAAFRYPFDTKGNPAWADSPIVPMQVLAREFEIHGAEVQDLYYVLREELESGTHS